MISSDESIRRDSTLDKLAALKAPFLEGGSITAGNASQISDGAAALLITTSEKAKALGLTPLARVHTAVVAGGDTYVFDPNTSRVDRVFMNDLGEVDSVEEIIVIADAPVPLAWQIETGAKLDRLNPVGGAIALGHPLGASGARLATTLVHHLRRTGGRYGVQTMCEGGGTANATVFERL